MQSNAEPFPTEPELGHDLQVCDAEPIHIPGAIQPYGLLLVADRATGRVIGGAGDLEARLAPDWMGRPVEELIGLSLAERLQDAEPGPGATLSLRPVTGLSETFEVSLNRVDDRWLISLEPSGDTLLPAGQMLDWLDQSANGFSRAVDLGGLAERAAIAFRQLTGFDRVMIYRFLEDDAGWVVGEDRDPAFGSFLHHHFPASDIPRQARALYLRNLTRVIADSDYRPAPLRPASLSSLDLSDVPTRSVSPIHLRYLRNMGVRASASISIVKDGVLWGLVACHHHSPRTLSPAIRAAARVLAGGLARQIRAREEASAYRERLRLRGAADELAMAHAQLGLAELARTRGDELARLLDADGFALVGADGNVALRGRTPDREAVRMLSRWVGARGGELFATRELASLYSDGPSLAACASGVVALGIDGEGMAIWFRAEAVEVVNWAGNPHKAVNVNPGEVLTPRASFETWSQTVRERARRWTLEEVDVARRFRRQLLDNHRNNALRELNAELGRALSAKDSLLVEKDMLMREVNHRVQNSLQLVASFLSMQARASNDPAVQAQLAEAQARLAAVSQVHRRLYRDDQLETVDLARYMGELIDDVKQSLGSGWADKVLVDLAPVLMPTDRAVNLGLTLTELVINATKYAYGGQPGTIAVTLEEDRADLRLIVADNGAGKGTVIQGTGFGGRMMGALVKGLGGELVYDDNRPGTRAIVRVPIEG